MESGQRSLSGEAGFTLLELLIVLSLISVLTGLSIPHFFKWQTSLNVQVAAQEIASRVRLAKISALEEGVITRIMFDPALNRLIYKKANQSSEIIPLTPPVELYSTNFPQNTLYFYSTGVPSCGGTIVIKARGQFYQLTVTPVTGRVHKLE